MTRLLPLVLLLSACGTYRPAVVRAAAVSIGALGTGLATAGHECATRSTEECQRVLITGSIVALGVALAAGSVAFLEVEGERAVALPPDGGVAPVDGGATPTSRGDGRGDGQ